MNYQECERHRQEHVIQNSYTIFITIGFTLKLKFTANIITIMIPTISTISLCLLLKRIPRMYVMEQVYLRVGVADSCMLSFFPSHAYLASDCNLGSFHDPMELTIYSLPTSTSIFFQTFTRKMIFKSSKSYLKYKLSFLYKTLVSAF